LPGSLPVRQGTVPVVESWDLTAVATPGGNRSPVVLYSDNEARVVLIGLEPGQELGEHEVKENAFLVVVDGVVQVAAGGQTIDAGAGTLVRFDPEERHAVSSRDGARLLLLLAPWPGKGHYRDD
jgi:quercetin dioxygenase-like cupin family protein